MRRELVERHPDLFEVDSPQIAMPSDQKQELVRFIEAMLIEIVTPMTAQESDDDKDYTRALGAQCLRVCPSVDG
jgi:hypothetical protein